MGSVGGGGLPHAVPVHQRGCPEGSGYHPGGGGPDGGWALGVSVTPETVSRRTLALNLTGRSRWRGMAEVVVVGAGVGGLGSALCLARAGHRVTILERD